MALVKSAKVLAGLFALVWGLAGCAASIPRTDMPAPQIDPVSFFSQGTIGHAVLVKRDGSIDRRFVVTSTPEFLPDGRFALRQVIENEDGTVEERSFIISEAGPGHWTGTLDGAAGEIDLWATGQEMRLAYALEGIPMGRMEQYMYLAPEGDYLINEGTVRVAGITVRRLHETIHPIGSALFQND